jgi:uncharacterized protein YndB with AHSA1/START domain
VKSDIKISGNRLTITRIFDAPRESVFRWWSQAEMLQQWSGCKDATSCEVEMDFRVGGGFRQTMQIAGAGTPFTITGTYEEIVVPEKIRSRVDMGMAVTHVLIELFEEGNRTKLVLTQDGFPSEDLCHIVSHGTDESLDKLDSILSRSAVPQRSIATAAE